MIPSASRRLVTLGLMMLCTAMAASPAVFTYADLPGLEPSATVMRRDPSDVIQVGDQFYGWYAQGPVFHGYDATIWYATSRDGRTWAERGER